MEVDVAKARQEGLVDFRGFDWSEFDFSGLGQRDEVKLRRAAEALDDPLVGDATYRLANFGDVVSANSWKNFREGSWLMVAWVAAVALDRLPG